MSVIDTKQDSDHSFSGLTNRRQALRGIGLGALSLGLFGSVSEVGAANNDGQGNNGQGNPNDISILNFALNLEYLEAEFYLYATTGAGLESLGVAVDGRGRAGDVIIKSNPQVPFVTDEIRQYAQEIAADEVSHVQYLRTALGQKAVARPTIDLQDSFTAAAQAAGLIGAGETFDPFADEVSFLLAAFIFEDVGVTAYRGAAPLVQNKKVLSAAAGILGTEAYHAGNIRAQIYHLGGEAVAAAQKISDLRDALDGATDDDQGVTLDGNANIVPTDSNGLVFARTAAQVLSIVYFAPNVNHGGFFPNGINTGRNGNR